MTQEEIFTKLCDILVKLGFIKKFGEKFVLIGGEEVSLETDILKDIDMDSLSLTEFSMEIEKEFNLQDLDIQDFPTKIGGLVDKIELL